MIKIRLTIPITLDFDSLVRVVIVIEEDRGNSRSQCRDCSYMGRKYVRVLRVMFVRKWISLQESKETETQVLKGLKPGDIVIGK